MDELPLLPGFREMALRRMAERRAGLVRGLVEKRLAAGLSQTEVAARMGTSQSAGGARFLASLRDRRPRLHPGALRGRHRRRDQLEPQ